MLKLSTLNNLKTIYSCYYPSDYSIIKKFTQKHPINYLSFYLFLYLLQKFKPKTSYYLNFMMFGTFFGLVVDRFLLAKFMPRLSIYLFMQFFTVPKNTAREFYELLSSKIFASLARQPKYFDFNLLDLKQMLQAEPIRKLDYFDRLVFRLILLDNKNIRELTINNNMDFHKVVRGSELFMKFGVTSTDLYYAWQRNYEFIGNLYANYVDPVMLAKRASILHTIERAKHISKFPQHFAFMLHLAKQGIQGNSSLKDLGGDLIGKINSYLDPRKNIEYVYSPKLMI